MSDPGNTLATATLINLTSSVQTLSDSVSSSDTNDYYRFGLTYSSSINLSLDGLSNNANVQLLNSSGGVIQDSLNGNTLTESINTILSEGSYYIRVFYAGSAATNYNLKLQSRNSVKPDIIWRNYGSATNPDKGKVQIWQMNGTTRVTNPTVGTVTDLNWRIEGTGDFTGDGQTDILWRNYGTSGVDAGQVLVWQMNGTTSVGSTVVSTVPDPNWQIEGTGDFNRDGKTDILWRNYSTSGVDAGKVLIWQMNGTTPGISVVVGTVGSINWQIEGTGDFTGDGQIDLLWRNYGTSGTDAGKILVWQMNGTSSASSITLGTEADITWQIEGTGDFNGDSKTDILWRNYSTNGTNAGRTLVWRMNGTTYLGNSDISPALTDTNWQAVAPFNRVENPIDVAGNDRTSAFNIGTLDAEAIYRDSVGTADTNDYYRFTLANSTAFTLILNGLSGNANVELLNNSGGVLQSSTNSGSLTESIRSTLGAGTYYIRVYSTAGANTSYTLNLFNTSPRLIKDLSSTGAGGNPQELTTIGNTLYFTAADSSGSTQLWKTDGSATGTVKVANLQYPPSNLTSVGNTLYFVASYSDSNGGGTAIWKNNGTPETTVLVKAFPSGSPGSSSVISQLTAVGGNKLYFTINGQELWISNGMPDSSGNMVNNVRLFSNPNSTVNINSISHLTAVGNTLYFAAYDPITGIELWKSDGTVQGTQIIKDTRPGSQGGLSYQNDEGQGYVALGNTLYFFANDGVNGFELWRSDGTAQGTQMVKNIDGTSGDSIGTLPYLTVVGNTLYFSATDSRGTKLWKSDGTAVGTVIVTDSPQAGFDPRLITAVGNTVYFRGYSPTSGSELWKSDGTAAGTILVKDIAPGGANSNLLRFTAAGNTLYFLNSPGTTGIELWKSNGTDTGTVLVKTVLPNSFSLNGAVNLAAIGDTIYFASDTGNRSGTYDYELWTV